MIGGEPLRRVLRERAALLAELRAFFAERQVLEVETPQLASAGSTDLHLESFVCAAPSREEERRYLQTSPELAMKRLLVAGSGPIFQICKAFRGDETGRRHNPEFTILEWYRPGWALQRLMDEVEALVRRVLGCDRARRTTYGELFAEHTGIEPHTAAIEDLRQACRSRDLRLPDLDTLDQWRDYLWVSLVEPRLASDALCFVTAYPASQAALARIDPGPPPVAERFELYSGDLELANGFQELTDAGEQRRRFERDLDERRRTGLPEVPIDERFLAALAEGLADCSGVALGVDRLLMAKLGATRLAEILPLTFDEA